MNIDYSATSKSSLHDYTSFRPVLDHPNQSGLTPQGMRAERGKSSRLNIRGYDA